MAARTPCNASGEDDHGGGDPQQILRSCAESLLTAVARLEGGERLLIDPALTPAARRFRPVLRPRSLRSTAAYLAIRRRRHQDASFDSFMEKIREACDNRLGFACS